jgi:hypothetical protein
LNRRNAKPAERRSGTGAGKQHSGWSAD